MRMNEVERRIREREVFMMHMQMAEQMRVAEEEHLMRRVIEESKEEANLNLDPTSPDVDNMTYEQLMHACQDHGW